MSIRQSPPADRPASSPRLPQPGMPATSMTAAQYKALKKPHNKYGNKITAVDGIKFRSKKEADRYSDLRAMERWGTIKNLTLQPRFPLVVEGVKVGLMVADFGYEYLCGDAVQARYTVEDVKGAKTLLWKLKWALAKVIYPHIDWRVT